jgi:hypothetical protein
VILGNVIRDHELLPRRADAIRAATILTWIVRRMAIVVVTGAEQRQQDDCRRQESSQSESAAYGQTRAG